MSVERCRPRARSRPPLVAIGLLLVATGLCASAPAQTPRPAPAPVQWSIPISVQVVVFSPGGSQPDECSLTYAGPRSKAEAERDLAALAGALGQPVPKGKVTTERLRARVKSPAYTSIEAKLPGIVDRTKGRLRLELFTRVFGRFPRLKVTYWVYGGFQPKGRQASSLTPGWELALRAQAPIIDCDLWQSAAVPAPPRSARGPGAWILASLLVLAAAALAGALAYYWTRRAAESDATKRDDASPRSVSDIAGGVAPDSEGARTDKVTR